MNVVGLSIFSNQKQDLTLNVKPDFSFFFAECKFTIYKCLAIIFLKKLPNKLQINTFTKIKKEMKCYDFISTLRNLNFKTASNHPDW